tara:strand:+ start:93 stop:500 length:408 start_codon:yes stop_codon:yes gene_type:complete
MAKTKLGSNAIFSGAQLGFSYIRNWVYAYSGPFGSNIAEQTILDTSSPKGFIVGEFQYNQPVNPESLADESGACQIKFNGVTIAILKVAEGSGMTGSVTQKVIIPPLTHIKVTCEGSDNQAATLQTLTFVGELHA